MVVVDVLVLVLVPAPSVVEGPDEVEVVVVVAATVVVVSSASVVVVVSATVAVVVLVLLVASVVEVVVVVVVTPSCVVPQPKYITPAKSASTQAKIKITVLLYIWWDI